MDWVNMWDNLLEQGIMFWSAIVAVALGVTLILTAGHLQWRRLRARPVTRVRALPIHEPETLSDPGEAHSGVEIVLQNGHLPVHILPAFPDEDRREMGVLMARLRSAADRLADLQGSRLQILSDDQDSQLKEGRNGVEYLFRTGKG
jgi:hypothetical protein